MKRAVISLVIGLTGVGLFAYELNQTMKIGTCASGNTPYLIANPCPSGTGTKIILLALGIVLAVAGMIIGAGRTSLLLWSALFLAGGIAALLSALGPHAGAGAKTAGYIIAATFIPMGALPLLWLTGNGFGTLRTRRIRARSKEAEASVSRIEELQRFGLNQAKIRVSYTVAPTDDASFEVSRETNVLLTHMPRPGQRVRIRYDPSHRDQFEVVSPSTGATGGLPAQEGALTAG